LLQAREPEPPRRLNRAVPRDLEAVCLKCLEKHPAKRYPDCYALADDLSRWLGGRATVARPLGVIEHAAKWARRRPTAAALVAVILLSIAMAGMGTLAFVARLQAERSVADSE